MTCESFPSKPFSPQYGVTRLVHAVNAFIVFLCPIAGVVNSGVDDAVLSVNALRASLLIMLLVTSSLSGRLALGDGV